MRAANALVRRALALRLGRWRTGRKSVVYIIPRLVAFAFLVFLVLLFTSNNSAPGGFPFLFGIIFVSLGLVGMIETNQNMARVRLAGVRMANVGVGQPIAVWVQIENVGRDPSVGLEVYLQGHKPGMQSVPLLEARSSVWLKLEFPGQTKRGLCVLPPVVCRSRYPLGMFVAWRLMPLAEHLLAILPLPRSLLPYAPLSEQQAAWEDELRAYQTGDSPGHVLWKASARRGQLVVRARDSQDSHSGEALAAVFVQSDTGLQLPWSASASLTSLEERLSQICFWAALLSVGTPLMVELPQSVSCDEHSGRITHALGLQVLPYGSPETERRLAALGSPTPRALGTKHFWEKLP